MSEHSRARHKFHGMILILFYQLFIVTSWNQCKSFYTYLLISCIMYQYHDFYLYLQNRTFKLKGADINNEFNSNKTMNNLSIISNLLIIMNSSVNFFVYLNKDPKFLLCFYHCISSSVESSCAEICRPASPIETCIMRWVHTN